MDTLFIIGTINLARETVFEENMALVYAFEYSAILDSKTSNICRDLDGTIFPATAKSLSDYSPPRHYMCRSLMIEILQDDPYKPAIDTKTIKNPGSDEPLPFSLAK